MILVLMYNYSISAVKMIYWVRYVWSAWSTPAHIWPGRICMVLVLMYNFDIGCKHDLVDLDHALSEV